ncbi:phage tail protein [Paraburkholderia bonniea]|uniref:phage tail protein n=1 Tax=Paraburkholderia bonniea TaxID=2152891 RepID=UPI0012923E55|nr:phage tail protein [Paraburkholderia bonniea]
MKKPASLRAALVAALPALETDPDRLAVFIDKGVTMATGTRTPSFEYRYVLNVLMLDFAGNPDEVMIVLIGWARANQPDLVTNDALRDIGITFEIDILNHETVDLSIKLHLTESVVVSTSASGERTVTHVDDAAEPWLT